MTVREHVPLSTLTTFKVGGLARYVIDCNSEQDVEEAVEFARIQGLPFRVLGGGSNVLASDDGYEGVLLHMTIGGITYEEQSDTVLVTAGAGVGWDDVVREVALRSLWGIENMAGIPGTMGAAPVQNIGAYGTELVGVFSHAQVYDSSAAMFSTYTIEQCDFAYRDSIFKHNRSLVLCSVTLALSRAGEPKLGYSDLATLVQSGASMDTPKEIGDQVRKVRAQKFPDLSVCGTAGSFFKNPIISPEHFLALTKTYGAIPSFPVGAMVKIPLAFILDRVLSLRGYRDGGVYLFGNQPLVLVADEGVTANEVDEFANAIEKKVEEATNIKIEREVQTF